MNEPLNPYERYEISGRSQHQRRQLWLREREHYIGQMTERKEEESLWEKQDIAPIAAVKPTERIFASTAYKKNN